MSRVEEPFEAANIGRATEFPDEWGFPPGTQFSEERAAWVLQRVREHRSLDRPIGCIVDRGSMTV